MKKRADWTKDDIKDLLKRDDRAVMRGLIVITSFQTAHERETHKTLELNDLGWNMIDADFMTSLAEQVKARQWLSAKQMNAARARLMKYAGQLVRVANGDLALPT